LRPLLLQSLSASGARAGQEPLPGRETVYFLALAFFLVAFFAFFAFFAFLAIVSSQGFMD